MNAARVAQRLGQCATHIKMLEATSAEHPERAARALALRNRISTSLEIGNFIHIPCPYGHWDMNLEDRRERLGLSAKYCGVRTKREQRLQDDLRSGAEGMRKQAWNFRIGEEVEQLDKRDWYTVMVTLTVDPSIADGREVIEDGKAWSAFLQRCSEVARQACGLAQRHRGGPPRTEYFRYVGVAEHGASRDHHHVHGLLHFRSLPASWIWDENDGVLNPRVQQLSGVAALWDYGVQTRATAFRFAGDVWSRRCGFVWPLKDDGSALDKLPARASGAYFGKYMGKEHKEWHHRMKASRGYGMSRLEEQAAIWSVATSLALLERPGSLPGTPHSGPVFGSFEYGQAVGTAFADLEGRHEQFRPSTVEEDAMDSAEIGRLHSDGEQRRGWSRPVVDGFRGALRLATGRVPPRGERIL